MSEETEAEVLKIEITSKGVIRIGGNVPQICQAIKENASVIFGLIAHMKELGAQEQGAKVISDADLKIRIDQATEKLTHELSAAQASISGLERERVRLEQELDKSKDLIERLEHASRK